ncbi:MAG: winged helix-turn-helix transcriptional regulator [Kiritimatiellae bacterium]|nr:winged helix-turn-helix transcriptional regulator [Kiritimatiellia bacterium]
MFDFMTATKAISDHNRVRILSILQERELCVCQIIKMLKLAPSTVSKHLFILRQARLIEDRKEGRWMHYRLPDNPTDLTENILALIQDSLKNDEQIESDNKLIKEILSVSKEELCQTQN